MNRIRAVIAVMFVFMFGVFYFSSVGEADIEAAVRQRPTTTTTTTIQPTTTTVPPTTTTTTQMPVAALRASPAIVVVPKVREPAPTTAGDIYDRLAQCESGMSNANTGNGYYGYFQFLPSTWRSMGEIGLPTDHPYEMQKAAAIRLIERSGWGQFPGCARKLGMR